MATPGSSRLMLKLRAAIEEKQFYEAHQLLKALDFRYSSAKKFEELEELLVKYSGLLLEQNQHESGMDVAVMLSQLYTTAPLSVTEKRVFEGIGLLRKMPDSLERDDFIYCLVKWAYDSELVGQLHAAAAKIYIMDRNFDDAWIHLRRVTDGNEAADLMLQFLIRVSRLIRRREVDLFIAHLVVPFMVANKLTQAENALNKLVRDGPIKEGSPLFNGIHYLIESAKMGDLQAYKSIRKLYDPSFGRDPIIRELVAKAEKSLFNSS